MIVGTDWAEADLAAKNSTNIKASAKMKKAALFKYFPLHFIVSNLKD